ncbi:MAG TPA: hypothetical protein P5135_02965 [Gemmatimonadales bacterium]|nr:hypothetical protein [Gemmatimonadales bacterium]HRX17995.1 hypothetical protein [Gemmatimonadales bacterium]
MSNRSIATALAALLVLPAGTIAGQRTNDESRLVVGLNLGYIGGGELWGTTQPIPANNAQTDQFGLSRNLRGNITMSGHLIYFPRPTLGISGELVYLGLGTTSQCRLLTTTGDVFNRLACDALVGKEGSASAIGLLAGGVWRPVPRGDVQLYVKGQGGLALVPRSTTSLISFFGIEDEFALPIYTEDGSRVAAPIGTLSFGLATAPNNGYQFSVEFRATAVQLQVVEGPAARGDFNPVVGSAWQVLPSVTLGFDIVLEKRRGRRY